MTELPAWSAAMRATAHRAMTPSVIVSAPVAVPAPVTVPAPIGSDPAMTMASVDVQVLATPSAAVMPVAVAPNAPVDEDDWEWTIALARARVASEEAEAAAVAGPPPAPVPGKTRPMAVVARKAPTFSGEQRNPEPIGAIPRGASTRAPAAMSRVAVPSTVIPVPMLPTLQNGATSGRFDPVVRTTAESPDSPYRIAKGTGSLDSATRSGAASVLSDDTVPNLLIGDRTKPGVALPPAARAVQLPSVKRRMSRQR
ncbi:MAG TPA: hypothetical protein VHN14_02255 [Kofleriaceae bacterium]|nr:hypothetical protein [Kofleriaceae bacterium]